jgi:hypothetical protein
LDKKKGTWIKKENRIYRIKKGNRILRIIQDIQDKKREHGQKKETGS